MRQLIGGSFFPTWVTLALPWLETPQWQAARSKRSCVSAIILAFIRATFFPNSRQGLRPHLHAQAA